ncbi:MULTISPECIES: trehalose phosphatase [Pseudomonas]|uniref:Trehalose phosphatase n=1 Tax=Pseudomonas neustonica TaxID=2487346 RepID=A0ABX9XF68_9PSED|nr:MULTISPECIES: trehalose phosphatase [Pseudomonas]MAB25221.1 trehalose phosphatase [Pseudomonadales bacterium]MBF22632.1 trehalose phosphatase [Pusillimonas sp.]MBA6419580.1 trehalose phosphatase [Pseudomonas sp. 5Ae-yellow]ROZ82489.1 trehalose phosphatase [Pseudomonas neustonica]ROZ82560.1 trehalose phosphatase [Pseudomonas sp. SSM44]|tara:strand:+ start:4143 stop:4901 length:759 start_codon:yes stop_codon:yes gene_type:complete
MLSKRPLAFVDLDDTLFQTARKMPDGTPRFPATLDQEGRPNGYMSPIQKALVEWLFATADVVPVTARSVEAYKRVQLPFALGAVCSHGGVILEPDGSSDAAWHSLMASALARYQTRLADLSETTLTVGSDLGFSLRGWVVEEAGLQNYVVTKHNGNDDSVLVKVLDVIQARGLLDGMYVHRNGNNLAFIPVGLEKRIAVQEWVRRDRAMNGERLVLGFGDSISDLGFMTDCDFWATPGKSQLARAARSVIGG